LTALQFVNTEVEVLNTAMPDHLLPIDVQFMKFGCADSVTCIPFLELFLAVQFMNIGVEV
jgi:hypothetical protein